MGTIAQRIRESQQKSFEKDFDLQVFLKFIEDEISKRHFVDVGIVSDGSSRYFKYDKRQYKDYRTDRAFPTFADGYECYVWRTNCQIPQKYVEEVRKELNAQGLRTSLKGACGYATYDVIEVKL